MKVYIVYTDDCFNGNAVDKVFSSEEKACQHVIGQVFNGNSYYSKLSSEELMNEARKCVEACEVE